MIKVDINQLMGQPYSALYKFFMMQTENEYEFSLRKYTLAPHSSQHDLFAEYLVASYTGQLLADVAETFDYFVPSPHSKAAFRYRLTVTETELLIDQIDFILAALEDNRNLDQCDKFYQHAGRLMDEALSDKRDCACWGLLHYANRYFCV